MKGLPINLLALSLMIATTSARIGDTPEQLKARYGDPVAQSADKDGNGLFIYRTAKFKEVRVTFVAGKSQLEKFTVADGVDSQKEYAALRRENPDPSGSPILEEDYIDPGVRTFSVGVGEGNQELRFASPASGKTTAYFGVLEKIKRENEYPRAVVRGEGVIIEIGMNGMDPSLDALRSGLKCKVSVIDEGLDGTGPLAVVGQREHLDWNDAIDDAHASLQILAKVESEGTTIFDRSICGTHHLAMKLSEVPIEYGMIAASRLEIYCDKHFPHFRDYAAGGCIVGETKTTRIYICPACVAACKEYAGRHPEK